MLIGIYPVSSFLWKTPLSYPISSPTFPAILIDGVRVLSHTFRLTGQACHGLDLTNSSARIFLSNSVVLLHIDALIISIDFTIPSGEMINVPLSLLPVSAFKTPNMLLKRHVLSLTMLIPNHASNCSVSTHLLWE